MLDSSAIIAVFHREPGADFIVSHLAEGLVSAVNVQEVVKKMLDRGYTLDVIAESIRSLGIQVVAHDAEDAYLAASLAPVTKEFGRGIGDRSCMALAIRLGVPAITTDRSWAKLEIPGLDVILAR